MDTISRISKSRDFWDPTSSPHGWRQWKTQVYWENTNSCLPCAEINNYLQNIRIRSLSKSDLLQWGKRQLGTFSLEEAYYLLLVLQPQVDTRMWGYIWKLGGCPKESSFIWLIAWGKALTCYRLKKKGFKVPSRCLLCLQITYSFPTLIHKNMAIHLRYFQPTFAQFNGNQVFFVRMVSSEV